MALDDRFYQTLSFESDVPSDSDLSSYSFAGDVIIAFENQIIANIDDLSRSFIDVRIDRVAELSVLRHTQKLNLKIVPHESSANR